MPNYFLSEPQFLFDVDNKYSPILEKLLLLRGYTILSEAQNFLEPRYEDNNNPFLMKGISETIDRLRQAIEQKEHITIYADYDADGIPGAVVLSSLFEKMAYDNYEVYIPDRHDEGYGIHTKALKTIQDSGSTLVITIDVGITGHKAADWCQEHELDLIITDHHIPLENKDGVQNLPRPLILVNPKQNGCDYPDQMLCGCGVIFKVVQAFISRYGNEYAIPSGFEKWLLDMVAIATISDVVPLLGENRIFVYYGMKVIKKTKNHGLKQLIWDAGISLSHINEEDIAFGITPKINAASRMSHPKEAFHTFKAKDELSARASVKHLVTLNNQRKKLVAQTMKKAYRKLEGQNIDTVIVVGSPDWKAGILGLVASKLVEKYQVPAFVWSEKHGIIKGSCRSFDDINLVDLMSQSQENSFLEYGGHAEAGGFSCNKKEIHFLKERLQEVLLARATEKSNENKDKKIALDAILTIDDVNSKTYSDIERLGPFGMGNPKPLFIFKNIIPVYIGQFGKTREHLEIHFNDSRLRIVRALCFFKTPDDYACKPEVDKPCNVIGHIEHSVFMGRHEVRIKIVDITKI